MEVRSSRKREDERGGLANCVLEEVDFAGIVHIFVRNDIFLDTRLFVVTLVLCTQICCPDPIRFRICSLGPNCFRSHPKSVTPLLCLVNCHQYDLTKHARCKMKLQPDVKVGKNIL